MIEFCHIHKKFGHLEVLKGVDLALDQGIVAVLGHNGSGKTTLLKIVLGMVLPSQGHVKFDGKSIKDRWDYRHSIGYLPQLARFPENIKVAELIKMMADIRDPNCEANELISCFNLQPFLQKRLGHLSGGTRQKVNLVLTLMFDPPVLILDEPTAGLDPKSVLTLKRIIRERRSKGVLILITTHLLNLVESLADEIIFLQDGVISFRGSIDQLTKKTGTEDLEESIALL